MSSPRLLRKYSQAHLTSPIGHLYLKHRVERMCRRLKWPGVAVAALALACVVLAAAFPFKHAWYQ